jgi:hypothetical protein
MILIPSQRLVGKIMEAGSVADKSQWMSTNADRGRTCTDYYISMQSAKKIPLNKISQETRVSNIPVYMVLKQTKFHSCKLITVLHGENVNHRVEFYE